MTQNLNIEINFNSNPNTINHDELHKKNPKTLIPSTIQKQKQYIAPLNLNVEILNLKTSYMAKPSKQLMPTWKSNSSEWKMYIERGCKIKGTCSDSAESTWPDMTRLWPNQGQARVFRPWSPIKAQQNEEPPQPNNCSTNNLCLCKGENTKYLRILWFNYIKMTSVLMHGL